MAHEHRKEMAKYHSASKSEYAAKLKKKKNPYRALRGKGGY